MANFQQALQGATSRNRELLHELGQTDYASPALKQNIAYIADLKSQIASADKELQRLSTITQDEHKDHVKYSESVMRRYAHKLGGQKGKEKFASKQEKEEREFLEAWQREREAKDYRAELTNALEKAQAEQSTQEADKARHDKAQAELDQMYEAIFSGPTPDVQGEDDLEQAVKHSIDWFEQCKTLAGNENRALQTLDKAKNFLNTALSDMDSARGHSRMDMVGGGLLSDYMERNALSKAQNNLTQCLRSIDEARGTQPAIPQLTEVSIDEAHMISDVLFDNMFADRDQHQRIKDSQTQMQNAMKHLESIRNEQQKRVKDSNMQVQGASSQLEDARKELQQARSEAFERFDDQAKLNAGAPPAYGA